MEIVKEEDWEGIIIVLGMPEKNNNKGYICGFHQGFTTWNRLKEEEEKQLPTDNGGLKILCSPRSRDFVVAR